MRSLFERGRDVVTRQGLGRLGAFTERVEDVALDQVGLGPDAVKIPLCRGWDVVGPRGLNDSVQQIGCLPQQSTGRRFGVDHRHFTLCLFGRAAWTAPRCYP